MVDVSCKSLRQCKQYIAGRAPFRWLKSDHINQILMVGPESSGKTTLLYKLAMPGWRKADMTREMANMKTVQAGIGVDGRPGCQDPGYHYEELFGTNLPHYGIWEIPGDEAWVRQWPMFYRYVRIDAVVYVVDAFSEYRDNLDRIFRAREQIQILLNEDELRNSCFWLVLNTRWVDGEDVKAEEQEHVEALFKMLGVDEILRETPHMNRFFHTTLNCAETSPDHPTWEWILREIQLVYLGMDTTGRRS